MLLTGKGEDTNRDTVRGAVSEQWTGLCEEEEKGPKNTMMKEPLGLHVLWTLDRDGH